MEYFLCPWSHTTWMTGLQWNGEDLAIDVDEIYDCGSKDLVFVKSGEQWLGGSLVTKFSKSRVFMEDLKGIFDLELIPHVHITIDNEVRVLIKQTYSGNVMFPSPTLIHMNPLQCSSGFIQRVHKIIAFGNLLSVTAVTRSNIHVIDHKPVFFGVLISSCGQTSRIEESLISTWLYPGQTVRKLVCSYYGCDNPCKVVQRVDRWRESLERNLSERDKSVPVYVKGDLLRNIRRAIQCSVVQTREY